MRVPKIENYSNGAEIETRKILEVPKVNRHISMMTEKDKIKLIKTVERIARSSQEYREYVAFLKKEINMTACSFFMGVNSNDKKKISIEIHHEPFTLFDITQIVLERWVNEENTINPILIAEEVMRIHYQGRVGLIPVSLTVHQLVHNGKLFIPLQNVYGNFISFLEEYDAYISEDLKEVLELKLKMSKDSTNQDMSILEKRYVYLEIDGMTFPQPLEES